MFQLYLFQAIFIVTIHFFQPEMSWNRICCWFGHHNGRFHPLICCGLLFSFCPESPKSNLGWEESRFSMVKHHGVDFPLFLVCCWCLFVPILPDHGWCSSPNFSWSGNALYYPLYSMIYNPYMIKLSRSNFSLIPIYSSSPNLFMKWESKLVPDHGWVHWIPIFHHKITVRWRRSASWAASRGRAPSQRRRGDAKAMARVKPLKHPKTHI